MSRDGSIPLPDSRTLALPVDLSKIIHSGGYVVTRQACERLSAGVLPLRANADDWAMFFRTGMLDRVRCVVPLTVTKSARFESTIGLYSLGNGLRGRLVARLLRHKIPPLHQLVLYRRQRILRRWGRSELVDTEFVEKPSRLC
jgi:hypothetical protein